MLLDVSNMAAHETFAARARALLERRWGRRDFDFLVNNAGVGGGFPFDQITEAQFDKLLATNFKGPYFLTQKLLPLIAEGGHIVTPGPVLTNFMDGAFAKNPQYIDPIGATTLIAALPNPTMSAP